jgi:MFS family permease
VALVLFVAASVLCASAQGILSLTAARILQGFGGGGLMVLSQALLGENVPRRQLGRAQGVLAAVIVASSTFGPVAGGVLTQFFGWPSIFLINLPLGALAMVLALRLPGQAASSKAGRFDWPGLLLFAGFVVPLLLMLEQMQRIDAATLSGTLASFGLSLLCLVLLLRHEARAAYPLFPLGMLRHPAMWRANAMAACSGALLVSDPATDPSAGCRRRLGSANRPAHASFDRYGWNGLVFNWLAGNTHRTSGDLPLGRPNSGSAWLAAGCLRTPSG